jgi:hypothetical protein
LPTSSRTSRAVAEVLDESAVISLHPCCGRCVAASHCAVDHVKTSLSLVQPQLKAGTAIPREVLRPPLDVEDAVGRSATYRGEDAEPTVDQIQVVPIRVDRVVVSEPWQARVRKGCVHSHELRVAVGRQIDARESRVVQTIREGQRNGDDLIIPVIAGVRSAWHDTAPNLSDGVVAHARCRRCRRSWTGRGCRRRSGSGRSRWRRRRSSRRKHEWVRIQVELMQRAIRVCAIAVRVVGP